ncbi:MAG: endonuclease/exonuclease/phosphatase family protein [Armatimonadetes bacterium]|nr:endonuclease/exonuclease/phosphatase family protein [Armatimonadota bacterium]
MSRRSQADLRSRLQVWLRTRMRAPRTASGGARGFRADNRSAFAITTFIILLLALERFPGEIWWPTLLLVYCPQIIWALPLLLLAVWFLVRRRWLHSIWMVLLAVMVLTVLVGALPPRALSKNGADLRVLTWNLYYGHGGPELPDVALSTFPDIICIQEANPWAEEGVSSILELQQFKGWRAKSCGELVILSRFPLKRLGTTHSALWVQAKVYDTEVVIINAHLAAPFTVRLSDLMNPRGLRGADKLRRSQVEEIISSLPGDRPVILCGDFNTPPNARIYRRLASVLVDSFRRAGSGLGLTYLRQAPLVRIDHIFTSSDIEPVRCWLPGTKLSNHKPVCTDVKIASKV